MIFWDKIKSWFRAGPDAKGERALFIVNATVLMGLDRTNGRLSPRDQLQFLRRLSVFAEREGVDVWALFEGHPLREVAHGDTLAHGVRVFFADNAVALSEMIQDLATKQAARAPLVVVSNRQIEENLVRRNIRVMRSNTFRKAIELAISSGGSSQQAAKSNGGGSRRPRRRGKGASKARQQQQPPSPPTSNPTPQAEAVATATPPPNPPSATDTTVRKLIDLVE